MYAILKMVAEYILYKNWQSQVKFNAFYLKSDTSVIPRV